MKITLAEFSRERSAAEIARSLGVSRSAISQMLDSDREIYVEVDDGGDFVAWEKRTIPARKKSAA